jgi:hypothetical protein
MQYEITSLHNDLRQVIRKPERLSAIEAVRSRVTDYPFLSEVFISMSGIRFIAELLLTALI